MSELSLRDFEEDQTSLEDFDQQEKSFNSINELSASHLSAQTTILSGGNLDQYNQLKSDIQDTSTQGNYTNKLAQIDNAYSDSIEAEAINMIADPELDDVSKLAAIPFARGEFEKSGFNHSEILAERALAEPSEGENEEGSEVRSILVDAIPELIEHKREMQKRINSLEMLQDTSTGALAWDFIELASPFAEWIHYERLGQQLDLPRSDFALLGEWKEALFEHVRSLPPEKRAQLTEELFTIIEDNSTVILPDGNDFVVMESLQRMFIDNDYSNFEKWFDNFTSVLDLIGVGAVARNTIKARRLNKALKDFENAERVAEARTDIENKGSNVIRGAITEESELRQVNGLRIRSGVMPQATSQILKDTNPSKARALHKAMAADESGEIAKAAYGTSRAEALSNDLLPEAGNLGSNVRTKISIETPEDKKAKRIREASERSGHTDVSDAEFSSIGDRLLSGFKNIKGTHFHPESVKLGEDGEGNLVITGRYSPVDSGFLSATRAIDNALFEFREYKLSKDDFRLYMRSGDEWKAIDQKDLMAMKTLRSKIIKKSRNKRTPSEKNFLNKFKEYDFFIGVEYKYKYSPEDLEISGVLTTGNSLSRVFDSMRPSWWTRNDQGSVVQHLFDPSSVIHPRLVNAAAVAVDRVLGLRALYVDLFEDFTKDYKKLTRSKPDRRAAFNDYINKANEEGLSFSKTDLLRRGFNDKEIKALEKWRRANDVMWRASNDDMVKTLRSKGYRAFVHRDTDTLLFGRPMKKVTASKVGKAYDPVEDAIVQVDVDELYGNGGELLVFSQPQKLGQQDVTHVISRNTPSGGYTRVLRDDEIVLPYREGYYPVMYDANWFIDIKVSKAGDVKTVASAKTLKDAKHFKQQIMEAEGYDKASVILREDRRRDRDKLQLFDEGSWNLSTNSGLTSQRHRGKRLAEAGVDLQGSGRSHLKDPLEAVADQIRSLSQRVVMRDVLEGMKVRWLQSYSQYLDLPIDKFTGKPVFPDSISKVKSKIGEGSVGMVADARTNFNYIYSLENGYINMIDEGYQVLMHSAANLMAELGWNSGEKLFNWFGNASPIQQTKIAAFKFFLSGNPLRQALIQRGQILQLEVLDPVYATKGMVPDLVGIRLAMIGLTKNPRHLQLYKEVRDLGLLEAVDAHTFIRDDALKLADTSIWDKTKTVATAPVRVPLTISQKLGFDAAEQDVLLTSWLVHRNLAEKAGKNLKSKRVMDEIHGQARAYTLTMNRAGEMAYSQNTLGLFTQFLSFSHKALLQPLTNKALTPLQRAKLAAYTTAIFGVDATAMKIVYDMIWGKSEPSPVKDQIEKGLLDTSLNSLLTVMSGEKQAISFRDFAPTEAFGFGNMFWAAINSDLGDVLIESPGGSLFFGNNPRVTDAVRTAIKWAYEPSDYKVEGLETDWTDVSMAFMNLFSGASNYFKSMYALESGRKMSATGKITDDRVTKWEAVAVIAGFRTHDEESKQRFNSRYYNERERFRKEVDIFYKELKRHAARREIDSRDAEFNLLALREAWVVFGPQREKVLRTIQSKLQSDADAGDHTVIEFMIRSSGLFTNETLWKLVNEMEPGEPRDRVVEMLNKREEMLNDGAN